LSVSSGSLSSSGVQAQVGWILEITPQDQKIDWCGWVGYCFSYTLKTQDEANTHIISTINRLEQLTGKRLGTLLSESGGEFTNKVLAKFLDEKGIGVEHMLPYHHYQNGVIERFNCTIADMGRTILMDSPLPKTFYSFAYIWAAYVLNSILNQESRKLTPYKALLGQKPQFDCFCIFGSVGYAHIPQEVRKKLESRATRGHVLAHCNGQVSRRTQGCTCCQRD